jgi:hypothetical protein
MPKIISTPSCNFPTHLSIIMMTLVRSSLSDSKLLFKRLFLELARVVELHAGGGVLPSSCMVHEWLRVVRGAKNIVKNLPLYTDVEGNYRLPENSKSLDSSTDGICPSLSFTGE